ncbi:MAG: hypothetical protein FWD06_04085 [Oscillospiraceae bacterium]|nr:hypothetical protein [Oscillospiraceae bacterium]
MKPKLLTADDLEELRLQFLLEQAQQEAEQGVWLSHDDVFAQLRARLNTTSNHQKSEDASRAV